MHQKVSRRIKRELKVYEIAYKLARCVENNVLRKHLWYTHSLILGFGLRLIDARFTFFFLWGFSFRLRFFTSRSFRRCIFYGLILLLIFAPKCFSQSTKSHRWQQTTSCFSQSLSCSRCFRQFFLCFCISFLIFDSIVEFEIDQPLQAEAPNFDVLPYLMVIEVNAKINFDWSRSSSKLLLLVLECE